MCPTDSPLLPYDISICGLDEIADFADSQVSHSLSILDPGWPDPEVFCEFPNCERTVFRFHDVIDESEAFRAPMQSDMEALLRLGEDLAKARPEHLLIHCHAGISRSTAAAITLLCQFNPGAETKAFAELSRVRPHSWPNSRMIGMADAMLGCGGRLTEALKRHYARMIGFWPEMAEYMKNGPRSREYWAGALESGAVAGN